MSVIPSYTFNLDARQTALIIVDMQYLSILQHAALARAGTAQIDDYRFNRVNQTVIPNLKRLLLFFRHNRLKVLHVITGAEKPDYSDAPAHTKHRYTARNDLRGRPEYEIVEELKPLANELILRKKTFSAFASTGIESALRSMAVDSLLFGGVLTNVCVGTTARDAADRGFKCTLIDDCCSASNEINHQVELELFLRIFGRVESTAGVIVEMEHDLASST